MKLDGQIVRYEGGFAVVKKPPISKSEGDARSNEMDVPSLVQVSNLISQKQLPDTLHQKADVTTF